VALPHQSLSKHHATAFVHPVLYRQRLRVNDTYVSRDGGLHRPIAIKWRLHHPLPRDPYTSFAAAVA